MDATKSYFDSLNPDPYLSFSNTNHSDNHALTHTYHRYPAKFIPKLASHLLLENTHPGDLICDPFGGCGTLAVEAKVLGRSSISIDINPLADLITNAKITPLPPFKLERYVAQLIATIATNRLTASQSSAPHRRLYLWFTPEAITELTVIFNAIQAVTDIRYQRFFLVAFSNILKNTSNWLTKSIKPTVDPHKVPADPFTAFTQQLNTMVKKNREFYDALNETGHDSVITKMYLRDARRTHLPADSIDYILTSPPYVTSYEYADMHQLSLLWFGYAPDWPGFKQKFIGTSSRTGTDKPLLSPLAEDIVAQLTHVDKPLAGKVRAYFEDMTVFLAEFHRILKSGKKMSLVLGNTTLRGVDILNAEVAFEQLRVLQFKDITVDKRQTSFQNLTPYRDTSTGQFTGVSNPASRRAYQFEYIVTATK